MDKQTILNDPATSYWLKDAIKTSSNRDILDALRDAQALVLVLENEWKAVFTLPIPNKG